ncbi:hypothetical protein TCAL_00132 [Tigriopus californicus]|uniref:protoporphyrinogen oxidase n=3 Tax=Tigriopus californicus TaxID=6832 RepID=A0A553PFW1_TIGCA|nr:hypothetical protein TCAL_00132 [Tigriopus californicus]
MLSRRLLAVRGWRRAYSSQGKPSECPHPSSCPMDQPQEQNQVQVACSKCFLLAQVPSSLNHFHLFSLYETFDVEQKVLSSKFKALQNVLHPDRFAGKSEDQAILADSWSSAVNDAYQNLSKPLTRALYLLECKGQPVQEGDAQVMDNEFLMHIMEVNEELDEVDSPEELAKLAKTNLDVLQDYFERISHAFQTDKVEQARELVKEMTYFCGLETFTQKWSQVLEKQGVEIRRDSKISDLRSNKKGEELQVIMENDEVFECDHLFLTIPAFVSSRLFDKLDPNLSNILNNIPFVDVGVVNLEFEGRVTDIEAFGFLVPSNQPVRILGTTFDTCAFPQGNKTIFTVMMGGKWFQELFGENPSPDSLGEIALSELRHIMNIQEQPNRVMVKIHRKCIAQYIVGHKQQVQLARERVRSHGYPLSLVGSSYDGAGVNDVIMSGKQQVLAVFEMSYVVAGGGLGGLAVAHYLAKLPTTRKILILEASSRMGGWVQTSTMNDGVYFEHGPRTVRPVGPAGHNTLNLIQELGLDQDVLPISRPHPIITKRLIYADGTLCELPSNLTSALRTLPPFKRPIATCLWNDIRAPAKICEDDTLFEFVSRRLGADIAQNLIDPMTRGICAGDARQISAAAFVAGPLFRMEQESGGIVKHLLKNSFFQEKSVLEESEESDLVQRAKSEKWGVWSLKGGLETFTQKWSQVLEKQGVEIRRDSKISDLRSNKKGEELQVIMENDEVFECDHLFLTIPAFVSSRLFDKLDPNLSNILNNIPFVDVGVVNLEFEGRVTDIEAFGFLVPSNQPVRILGTTFDTCAFPQGNKTIFTVMMGGKWFQELFGENPSPDSLGEIALSELRHIMNIQEQPNRVMVKIHRKCIAQYIVGHKQQVQLARERVRSHGYPLSLVGSSYDGAGVNDVIMSGKQQVLAVFE